MKENKKFKKGITKNIAILVITIVLIIVVSIIIVVVKNKNQESLIANNQSTNIKPSKIDDTVNYIEGKDKTEYNTSQKVAEDKKIENILIKNNKIVYSNGVSKLTAKVTNNSVIKENLKFKIKFIANDGSIIGETIGLIGEIGANESKYIDVSIIKDVVNTKDVTFEVIK